MLAAEKALDLLAKRITACARRGFLPQELLNLIHDIYAAQLQARALANVPAVSAIDTADASRHNQGAPLLARASFPYDQPQAEELFRRFLASAATYSTALSEAAHILSAAIESSELDMSQAMQAHLKADESFFSAWATKTPSAPRLLPMLVQAALTPSLEKVAQELSATTDLKVSWPHGHCPICGSFPIMSDLREKEGFRYNTCSFCHAEYHVPRLQCPFCLEKDTAKLAYYEAPEEPGLRIHACSTCNMYIKVTDFRTMDRKPLALIDDLESLSLDLAAREKSLNRPTLSAWGF